MLDGETQLSELAVRKKLGQLRGHKVMHFATLRRAMRESGLPGHPNPFGKGYIFYWSEVDAWLRNPQRAVEPEQAPRRTSLPPGTERRKPGRPRANGGVQV